MELASLIEQEVNETFKTEGSLLEQVDAYDSFEMILLERVSFWFANYKTSFYGYFLGILILFLVPDTHSRRLD